MSAGLWPSYSNGWLYIPFVHHWHLVQYWHENYRHPAIWFGVEVVS